MNHYSGLRFGYFWNTEAEVKAAQAQELFNHLNKYMSKAPPALPVKAGPPPLPVSIPKPPKTPTNLQANAITVDYTIMPTSLSGVEEIHDTDVIIIDENW